MNENTQKEMPLVERFDAENTSGSYRAMLTGAFRVEPRYYVFQGTARGNSKSQGNTLFRKTANASIKYKCV